MFLYSNILDHSANSRRNKTREVTSRLMFQSGPRMVQRRSWNPFDGRSLDFINFPRRFAPGRRSEIKSEKTTNGKTNAERGREGDAISRRDSRSFHSNGPWTIIERDLEERIAPRRARRQTQIGDPFSPEQIPLSFSRSPRKTIFCPPLRQTRQKREKKYGVEYGLN